MAVMRAKMKIGKLEKHESGNETLHLSAVGKNTAYPEDGSDENNNFAKFTPSASLIMQIANPALVNKFVEGDVFYVDFTRAEDQQEA